MGLLTKHLKVEELYELYFSKVKFLSKFLPGQTRRKVEIYNVGSKVCHAKRQH